MAALPPRLASVLSVIPVRRYGPRRAFASTSRCWSAIEEHDIVIVGGGPAGLVLASALAASEIITATHKITLLEAQSLDKVSTWGLPPHEWSNRVSSITAEHVALLKDIGVWSHVDHKRTQPVEEMQVWDGLSSSRIGFHSPVVKSPLGSVTRNNEIEPMATLMENLNLQRACLRFLDTSKAVEKIDGQKVNQISEGEGGWPVVEMESAVSNREGRKIRSRLLIGADGYSSPVKSYSKIETFGWAYDNHGIVATMQIPASNNGEGMSTAWQRFLPEGPIAFLPLSKTTASLVWTTRPALASAIKKLPIAVLSSLINAAFASSYEDLREILVMLQNPASSVEDLTDRLSVLTSPKYNESFDVNVVPDPLPPPIASVQAGSVASFPLRLSHVSSYLGVPRGGLDQRTALLGDAAHTIHPLAGQGLNMGLGDVKVLVKTLEGTITAGGDVGSYISLKDYPRKRYFANDTLLSACDHLATLYGSQFGPLVWARSTGLEIINELDSVKRLLMGTAGAKSSERNAGFWGTVASTVQGARNGFEIVKMGGSLIGSSLQSRFGGGRAEATNRANHEREGSAGFGKAPYSP